jgi:hypothetical protein
MAIATFSADPSGTIVEDRRSDPEMRRKENAPGTPSAGRVESVE